MGSMEPFVITPVYDVLLRGSKEIPVGVYQLQLTTADQLTRLHYSAGSIKAVKARLKTLVEHHFLQSDAIPTKQYRSPYYYALGPQAIAYLGALGYDLNAAWRAQKEVNKHALFIEHTMELNDILISAALLERIDSRYRLHSFQHERVLKRQPFKVEGLWNGVQRSYNLIPDAFVDFRLRAADGERRLPLLVEHDRGTEDQRYFRQRVRAYIAFLKAQGYRERLGTSTISVAFTTFVGAARMQQMREWTYAELSESGDLELLGGIFCFAVLAHPVQPHATWLEPVWYAPYDAAGFALLAA